MAKIIEMDANVVTKDMIDDPARWATYDPETATELWAGTEEIWNTYIK